MEVCGMGEIPGRGSAPPGYAIVRESLQVDRRAPIGRPSTGAPLLGVIPGRGSAPPGYAIVRESFDPTESRAAKTPATGAPMVLLGMGEMGGKFTRWQLLTPSEAKMRGMIRMEGGTLSPQQVELVRQLVARGVPANEIRDILAKDELQYLAQEQQEILPLQTQGVGAVRLSPIYSSQHGADILKGAYAANLSPYRSDEPMSRAYAGDLIAQAAETAALCYSSRGSVKCPVEWCGTMMPCA